METHYLPHDMEYALEETGHSYKIAYDRSSLIIEYTPINSAFEIKYGPSPYTLELPIKLIAAIIEFYDSENFNVNSLSDKKPAYHKSVSYQDIVEHGQVLAKFGDSLIRRYSRTEQWDHLVDFKFNADTPWIVLDLMYLMEMDSYWKGVHTGFLPELSEFFTTKENNPIQLITLLLDTEQSYNGGELTKHVGVDTDGLTLAEQLHMIYAEGGLYRIENKDRNANLKLKGDIETLEVKEYYVYITNGFAHLPEVNKIALPIDSIGTSFPSIQFTLIDGKESLEYPKDFYSENKEVKSRSIGITTSSIFGSK